MKRIADYFKNRINLWLLPLLMTAAAASVIVECYMPDRKISLTVVYFLYALVTFALLDLLSKRRLLGGLVYVILLLVIVFNAMRLVFTAEYYSGASMSFQQWFYASFENTTDTPPQYALALFVAGGFFLNSVVYYFTQIRYRALGTLLILFIPFVIYAKRQDIMSDLTITVLITLYLAVMVHNRIFLSEDNGKGTVVGIAYVLSVAIFVSVAGALSMLVPDMSSPSRLEKDADMFNFGNNVSSGERISNDSRSTRFHGAEYTNEPILYVYPQADSVPEIPIYLRRRSMNVYDPETFEWYAGRDLVGSGGLAFANGTNFYRLYDAMSYQGKNGGLSIGAESFENSYEENSYSFELEFADNRSINFIPAPLYSSVNVDVTSVSTGLAYNDFYYLSSYINGNSLGRIQQTVTEVRDDGADFARSAGSDFSNFYNDAYAAYRGWSPDTGYDADRQVREDMRFAFHMSMFFDNYYKMVNEHYNWDYTYLKERGLKDYDKIKALADEIVKDCNSDYEKIVALEQYFEDADFTYDLDFVPSDESISYFLFESKTGICIDFASAMTVMLEMEDIPCRYVEGFVVYEVDPDDNSRFIVRDSHAHAFVEAFVPYVGWMTFDPTVAGYMREYVPDDDSDANGFLTVFMTYLGRILIVLAVAFVLVFVVLFDRIWELFFRIRNCFGTPEQRLLRLYRHISALLEYEDKTDLGAYTSDLLNEYIERKTGSQLREVTGLFERNRFGRAEITKDEYERAYAVYRALLPALRKKPSAKNDTSSAQET